MNIKELVKQKNWETILVHSPENIAASLGFKDTLKLAYKLLYNDKWDEKLQNYAVKLIYSIREAYPSEWASDWHCEAFLGRACDITLKYDERYQAFKNAYLLANPPPPELLIEMARCCYSPGESRLSYEEAIALVEKALETAPFVEAITLLKSIFSSLNDKKQEAYWTKYLSQIGSNKPILRSIEPNFLSED